MSKEKVLLPAIIDDSATALDTIVTSLGVPREILPPDEDIEHVWSQLPRQLSKIPPEYRTEHHVRMCVAVANGLFDAAINYTWNAAILRLRDRVRAFGLNVVAQILQKDFDDSHLVVLRDSELLELCLKLDLISEDGHFFLDQCREIRNNFSSAHPAMGDLDDTEVLSFLSRCTKHAMSDESDPRGVDLGELLRAVKGPKFIDEQKDEWIGRILGTHDMQRAGIVTSMHGVYCDPNSQESDRLNAASLLHGCMNDLPPSAISALLNQHTKYVASGKNGKIKSSRQLFEALGLLTQLSRHEQHSIFSKAISDLKNAHNSHDNFHNEPPFARRLSELTQQAAVPSSAVDEFVETLFLCAVGNQYGVSWNSRDYYNSMVQNLSPKQVAILFDTLSVTKRTNFLRNRIISNSDCRRRFKSLLGLIDVKTVPRRYVPTFNKWR